MSGGKNRTNYTTLEKKHKTCTNKQNKCIITLTVVYRLTRSSSVSDGGLKLSWFSSSTMPVSQSISDWTLLSSWLRHLSRSSTSACSNATSFPASSSRCFSCLWRLAAANTGSLSASNVSPRFSFALATISLCSDDSLCQKHQRTSVNRLPRVHNGCNAVVLQQLYQ